MDTAIVVPARLHSQRFPRKLLQEVKGKPLVLYTAERVRSICEDVPLFFAVAEKEIAQVLEAAGFQCVMTDPDLPSGTDRLAQANETIQADYLVNIQADEPLVSNSHLSALLEGKKYPADIVTLGLPFSNPAEFLDANKVKVVCAEDGSALYFSRSPIPFVRGVEDLSTIDWASFPAWWHLGMYAYRKEFLQAYRQLSPGRLESLEKLEQLRALENGYRIKVLPTDQKTLGVDTEEDFHAFAQLV